MWWGGRLLITKNKLILFVVMIYSLIGKRAKEARKTKTKIFFSMENSAKEYN